MVLILKDQRRRQIGTSASASSKSSKRPTTRRCLAPSLCCVRRPPSQLIVPGAFYRSIRGLSPRTRSPWKAYRLRLGVATLLNGTDASSFLNSLSSFDLRVSRPVFVACSLQICSSHGVTGDLEVEKRTKICELCIQYHSESLLWTVLPFERKKFFSLFRKKKQLPTRKQGKTSTRVAALQTTLSSGRTFGPAQHRSFHHEHQYRHLIENQPVRQISRSSQLGDAVARLFCRKE